MEANLVQVTELLAEWGQGDQAALNRLMPILLADLKRIAKGYLAREAPGQTLQPTALVNEAYLKLVAAEPRACESRTHFFALSAQIMRHILVDHARAKRGPRRGGNWQRVTFDNAFGKAGTAAYGLSELDEALASLAKVDARKSRLVELRLFGGLSNEEAAQVLQVSLRTVVRDWTFAKAWLAAELGQADGSAEGSGTSTEGLARKSATNRL